MDSFLARSKRESSAIDLHRKLALKKKALEQEALELEFQKRKFDLDKREAQLAMIQKAIENKIVK